MTYFESDKLYDALNVAGITGLLDTVSGTVGLFNSRSIPDFFTGYKTINYYLTSPVLGGIEYGNYVYIVACRAKTDVESRQIASAVFTELNRNDYTDYHTNCNVLATLPPANDTDVYSTPIEVILKTR
jgi:hypothetical protein